MPEQPLDAFQFGQQTLTGRIVVLCDAAGILAQHRDAHGDVEPIEHVFGFRRNKFRQSAELLSPVGQEGHILVCLQALTFEQIEQTAFGFGIISMHQADVTGVTVFRYRLTDDDLEIGFSIVPITYIAAIEADHDAAFRNGQPTPVRWTAINETRPLLLQFGVDELAEDQQDGATSFAPRCLKDVVEEELFARRRDLFSTLDLVFMDTTSPGSSPGAGGQTLLVLTKRKKDIEYEAKAVTLAGRRYVVGRNGDEMKKDAAARAAILAALERQLKKGDKSLIGNKGYRRFLATRGDGHFAIDRAKAEEDAKFDGVFVLRTNADLSPLEAMLCYKQLWRLCHVAVPRARSIGTSGIVRPLRLQSATWSSPQREARGAFGLRGDGVGR